MSDVEIDNSELDLMMLLPDELFNHPDYCSKQYWRWEQEVAAPKLRELGWQVQSWVTLDGDSFGPLVRGVYLKKDGEDAKVYSYG